MAQINAYEHLDLSELSHSLGEIQTDDLESTQNALIILVQLVREQAQEITVLKAEIEHLGNVAELAQEIPGQSLANLVAQHARINELEMWRGNRPG